MKKYYPFLNSKYEVTAGLRPLKYEADDVRCFDVDEEWARYSQAKQDIEQKKLKTLYCPPDAQLSAAEKKRVTAFFAERLAIECPAAFKLSGTELRCALAEQVVDVERDERAFEKLALLVQEDVAIWKLDEATQTEWLASLHVCFPSGWDPSEKIGRSFVSVHAPVVNFEPIAKKSWALVESMVKRGPFFRFVWGVAVDNVLDHHPENKAKLPRFNALSPQLFVRVERQTLHPFPTAGLSLFTIRTYLYDVKTLSPDELQPLTMAIQNMTPAEQDYKGIAYCHAEILNYLASLKTN